MIKSPAIAKAARKHGKLVPGINWKNVSNYLNDPNKVLIAVQIPHRTYVGAIIERPEHFRFINKEYPRMIFVQVDENLLPPMI